MSSSPTWECVADELRAFGVDAVFGLPGDDMAILGALDSRGIRVSLVRDQRNAVSQAIGYGRISGRPSVCFVGKGPALTHAATGLLEARSMRHPLVLISSGVSADRFGTGAFQELDALDALASLTVGALRVDERTVAAGVAEAFRLSTRRGRGPVILEVPEGLEARDATPRGARAPIEARVRAAVPLPEILRRARRPLVLVGGGCSGEGGEILAWVEQLGAAVTVTASGRGLIDETHPAFLGVSGLYLPAQAAEILRDVDVIVALGSRLEETATFGWDGALAPGCPIVQVLDHEADFVTGRMTQRIVADVGDAVRSWREVVPRTAAHPGWAPRVAAVHRAMIDDLTVSPAAPGREPAAAPVTAPGTASGAVPGPQPAAMPRVSDVLRHLDGTVPTARISIHENGLHDIWSYVFPHWIVRADAACLVPSEQTPLGFGMAAARGVAVADTRPVVVIGGDGAFGAVGPDLAGLAEIASPVLVVVLSNGGFGWLEANRRRAGAPFSFVGPRTVVAGLCAAYGLERVGCDDAAQLADAVDRAWRLAEGGRVVVLDVAVSLDDVPPGFDELAGDFPAASSTREGRAD